MPKFVKMSADEAQAKRKDHLANVGGKDVGIVKAAKAPSSWNDTARSARFTMSTASVDRYGDIVVTAGIDTSEFERNPVGLLFHSSRSWPVGTWGDLTKELNRRPPRLEGTLEMLPEGGPVKEVDEAAWMIANGGIRACSIGFQPNWDDVEGIVDDDGFWTGLKFNSSTLLECSICSVPANAQALIRQADGDPRLARELLEDVLDNWVRSPEGLLLERSEFEKAYRVTVEKVAEDEIVKDAVDTLNEATDKLLSLDVADDAAPAITDEIIAAFVKGFDDSSALGLLIDNDEPRIIRDADSKLLLPVTMTIAEVNAIYERVKAAALKERDLPENKPETPAPIALSLSVDTTEAEAAVTKVEGLFGRLAKQFPMFFPKAIEERIEPTIEDPAPPAPPTAEEIAAAKAMAASTRERLAAKGLIAA